MCDMTIRGLRVENKDRVLTIIRDLLRRKMTKRYLKISKKVVTILLFGLLLTPYIGFTKTTVNAAIVGSSTNANLLSYRTTHPVGSIKLDNFLMMNATEKISYATEHKSQIFAYIKEHKNEIEITYKNNEHDINTLIKEHKNFFYLEKMNNQDIWIEFSNSPVFVNSVIINNITDQHEEKQAQAKEQLTTTQQELSTGIESSTAVLDASDYETNLDGAPRSEDELLSLLKVYAFDSSNTTGLNAQLPVSVVDTDGYDYDNPKTGTYQITFEAADPANNIVTVTRELKISKNPDTGTITGNDIHVDLGTSQDEAEQLIAATFIYTDMGESIMTDPTLLATNYQADTGGTYYFTYSAEAPNAMLASRTYFVTVDDPIQAKAYTTPSTITSYTEAGLYLEISNGENEAATNELERDRYHAFSSRNGEITNNPDYVMVSASCPLGTPLGASCVSTIEAQDSETSESPNRVTTTIQVFFHPDEEDALRPIISGNSTTVLFADAPKTSEELLTLLNVEVYDPTDPTGTIVPTYTYVTYTDYNPANPRVGKFYVNVKATGSTGLKTTTVFELYVQDDRSTPTYVLDPDRRGTEEITGNSGLSIGQGVDQAAVEAMIDPKASFTDINGTETAVTPKLINTNYDSTTNGTYFFEYEAYYEVPGNVVPDGTDALLNDKPNNYYATKYFLVTVDGTAAPTISVPADVTLAQGESYDVTTDVTATDAEDGDLTSAVTYTSAPEFKGNGTDAPGEYIITYTVEDSTGKTATDTLTITVVANAAPVLTVPGDTTIKQGESIDLTTGVSALDTEDGDLTSTVTYTSAPTFTGTGSDAPGDYVITYSVEDSFGAVTTETRTITVVANNAPVLTAPSDTTIYQGEKFDFTAGVNATDVEDGDLTSTVTYTSSPNFKGDGTDLPGEYVITYTVTDSFGTVTTETCTVTVLENTAPVIQAPSNIEIVEGEPIDLESVVSAHDLEDGDLSKEITYTSSPDFKGDGTDAPGDYAITFYVTDSIGITTTFTMTITVLGEASQDAVIITPGDSSMTGSDPELAETALSNIITLSIASLMLIGGYIVYKKKQTS